MRDRLSGLECGVASLGCGVVDDLGFEAQDVGVGTTAMLSHFWGKGQLHLPYSLHFDA